MKKISLLLMCFVLFSMATCFAGYPKYLHGDRNCPLIQRGTYIIKSSLNVLEYNPPRYRITAKLINADMDGNAGEPFSVTFFYEYQQRKMYAIEAGNYVYVDSNPYNGEAANANRRAIGEKMFYLAYGIPFYEGIFDREFYNR